MTPRAPRFFAAALAALALASPARAFADDDADGAPRPIRVDLREQGGAPRERVWYGWEPLVADAAAMVSYGAGLAVHGKALSDAGLGLYGAASPTIHVLHDHAGKAVASFFLRVGAPLALGVAGYALAPSRGDGLLASPSDGPPAAAQIGVAVGMLAAIAIDDALLAREEISSPAGAPRDALVVRPTAAPVRDGGIVGVVGSF
jgi:hypothetical protein